MNNEWLSVDRERVRFQKGKEKKLENQRIAIERVRMGKWSVQKRIWDVRGLGERGKNRSFRKGLQYIEAQTHAHSNKMYERKWERADKIGKKGVKSRDYMYANV